MLTLRELLLSSGYRTCILAESRWARGPDIHRLDARRRALARLACQLSTIPDAGGILHGHGSLISYPNCTTMTLFRSIVSARRLVWIETLHDETLISRYEAWPSGRQELLRASLRGARQVLAIGRRLTDFAVRLGVDDRQLVESSPLLTAHIEPGSLSGDLADFVGRHRPLLVGVGAPTPDYDLESFLRAFERLRVTHGDAGLVLALTGFAADPAYSERLAFGARRLGSCVRIVTDVPRPEFLGLIAASDVVLRGPIAESFGMVRAEAALLRRPLVGTPTGSDEFTVTYAHGDAAGLHEALRDVLDRRRSPDAVRAFAHYRELAETTQQAILHAYTAALG
jgi:glycosyltransferase involved in cell wall biosynthesis